MLTSDYLVGSVEVSRLRYILSEVPSKDAVVKILPKGRDYGSLIWIWLNGAPRAEDFFFFFQNNTVQKRKSHDNFIVHLKVAFSLILT